MKAGVYLVYTRTIKMKNKFTKAILLILVAVATLVPVFASPVGEVRFGVLKGPTGIGASYLLSENKEGKTINKYTETILAEATDMIGQLAAGQLDIAAIPTNAAVSLYNKTNGGVRIIALNTAGVLYILENGNAVSQVSDLKGKTLYAVGQGSNPEYVLRFILSRNGIDPDKDVDIQFLDSAELTTRMATGEIEVCMLPVPAVTTVLTKNPSVRIALDLTDEWDKLNVGSKLTMGCVVVRTEFLKENKAAVLTFLREYQKSIEYVKANPAEAGQMCADFGIVPAAAIATKAIPDSNLIFVSGDAIRPYIEGYFQVLYDANPKAIGGAMPKDDFYTLEI